MSRREDVERKEGDADQGNDDSRQENDGAPVNAALRLRRQVGMTGFLMNIGV